MSEIKPLVILFCETPQGAVHLRRRQALGWRGMISLVNLRRSLLLNIGRKGSKSEKNRRRLKWKAQKHYRKVFCV